jgi:hypothetical protein
LLSFDLVLAWEVEKTYNLKSKILMLVGIVAQNDVYLMRIKCLRDDPAPCNMNDSLKTMLARPAEARSATPGACTFELLKLEDWLASEL